MSKDEAFNMAMGAGMLLLGFIFIISIVWLVVFESKQWWEEGEYRDFLQGELIEIEHEISQSYVDAPEEVADCMPGQYPLGVDKDGNSLGCGFPDKHGRLIKPFSPTDCPDGAHLIVMNGAIVCEEEK